MSRFSMNGRMRDFQSHFSGGVRLIALLAVAFFGQAAVLAASDAKQDSENLVQSPNPILADQKPAQGWTIVGDSKAAPEPEYVREGMATVPPTQTSGSRLSYVITAPRRTEVIITAEVRSNGKVIGYAGDARMSYHRQGQWQTLAGFARVPEDGKLELAFLVSSLDAKGTSQYEIRNVSVRALKRPEQLERRPAQSLTPVVTGGEAQVTIIYPSGDPAFKTMAQQVADKIKSITGATIPMLSDTEATLPDAPVLLPELKQRNLILIGRLGINRGMWTAYGQWLDATDGFYPGGEGYNVRTAINVSRNNKNHLIVGGSTDAGVKRAVEKFLAVLDSAKGAKGELTLPFTLEVELGGDCLAAYKKHDATWTKTPNDASLPPVEPGYGSVRRWYENAMGWYWTGWDSYKKREQETLAVVLKDRAYTHHYIAEFLTRTYDMVDETGLLSPEQRTQMETLILANFLDFTTKAGDGGWMTTFTPPYDNIQCMNRHQISPWMADYTMAKFLHRTYNLPPELDTLTSFRESEKGGLFDHMLATRWESSLPGGTAETQEELSLVMIRLATENEQYGFFNEGRARRMINLEKVSQQTGTWVRGYGGMDLEVQLGALATYYKDGRYLWLVRNIPMGTSFFNRTLNGTHCFVPGPEVKEADPTTLAGVLMPPTMPHRARELPRLQSKMFQPIAFEAKDVFDYLAFRSGYKKDDDFVAINGLVGQSIPGIFVSFMCNGVRWLPGTHSESYFDHDAIHVQRTDKWTEDKTPFAAAAKLNWKADLNFTGGVSFTLTPHNETAWQRSVIWLDRGLYVVRDSVAPNEDGKYNVTLHWRPAGIGKQDGNSWLFEKGEARFRLTPLTTDLSIQQEFAESLTDKTPIAAIDTPDSQDPRSIQLRLTTSQKLLKEKPITSYAVLDAFTESAPRSLTGRAVENGVLLADTSGKSTVYAVLFGPSRPAGLETDAGCVVISGDTLKVMSATRVTLAGKQVLSSEKPVSVSINCKTGEVCCDVKEGLGEQKITILGAAAISAVEGASQTKFNDTAALSKLLADVLGRTSGVSEVAVKPTGEAAKPADVTATWTQAWKFDGLRQPTAITPQRSLGKGAVDLGREVLIAEIAPRQPGGAWRCMTLPKDLQYAPASPDGKAPAEDSLLWKSFSDQPVMVHGVINGNYGRSEPVDEAYEILRPANVRARYLRSNEISTLIIRDAEQLGREAPLTSKWADLDGDGEQELIVNTLPYPKYLRPTQRVVDTLAVFSADGKQRFRNDYDIRVQCADLVRLTDNKPTILLATLDGLIRLLNPDGTTARQFDLYALHKKFHETFGRNNTRQPAGGFTNPFSVGPWRVSGSEPGFVVGRYHSFSFIGSNGDLEGVLMTGAYVQPAMLSQGVDFDGDGNEEQLCMGRGMIFRIHGPINTRVEEPAGAKFFPQVYDMDKLAEPTWDDRLDGARPFIFQTVNAGAENGRKRYVACAREGYLGIYDGLENRWAFSWPTLLPIVSAAIIEDKPGQLKFAVVTSDGLLWRLEFGSDLAKVAKFDVVPLDVDAKCVDGLPDKPGLVLAGADGIHLVAADGAIQKIANGSFIEARCVPSKDGSPGVVAISRDASIVRFDLSGGRK